MAPGPDRSGLSWAFGQKVSPHTAQILSKTLRPEIDLLVK